MRVTRPVMVRIRWKARVAIAEIPVYWQHATEGVWWVLGECIHYQDPVMRRSRRKDGPTHTPCYQCAGKL